MVNVVELQAPNIKLKAQPAHGVNRAEILSDMLLLLRASGPRSQSLEIFKIFSIQPRYAIALFVEYRLNIGHH